MEIIFNEDYSSVLLPKLNAIVTGIKDVPRTTSAMIVDDDSEPIAFWGDNNDFPQKVIEDIRKDAEIGTLINKMSKITYSGGIVYGEIIEDGDGKEKMVPLPPEDHNVIKDWMSRTNINRYLREATRDLYTFYNAFPELVLNVGRTEIVQLCVQPAEQCRWSKQDNRGFNHTCYINANFPDAKSTDESTVKLPVIDPYYAPEETLRSIKKGTNFIYPISFPTPGSKHYQMADWNSIRTNGWLEVSQAIPKFKKALLEKQFTIKYHIEISNMFWELKYPDWQKMNEETRRAIRDKELENFNAMMSGLENSGNSIVNPFRSDFNLGKEYSMWKITPIDDKIKQGAFLEEGKDASLYKQAAIGLHPALAGTMPNSGMGGAGSNIREAYNLHIITARDDQDLILEPLYLVKKYNNWNPKVEFRFRNSFMNTLDKGTETTNTIK